MKYIKTLLSALFFTCVVLLLCVTQSVLQPHTDTKNITSAPLKQWEQSLLQAAQLCHNVYQASEKGTTFNVILSEQVKLQMVDAVASLGFPVIDDNMEFDMRNPESLMEFGSGTIPEAAYYIIHTDGHIGLNILTANTVISLSASFTDTPKIYLETEYALTDITYTDKGWLIYTRDQSQATDPKLFNVDPHTMIRVTPLSQELRTLCDTYILPMGYSENNLFIVNWSKNDYSQVDFSSLYAMLFGMTHNGENLTWYTAQKYYKQIDGTELFLIPETEFEAITQQYFDIPSPVLRRSNDYNPAQHGYYFLGWQTGYYHVVPRIPVPEVVAAWENSDGTLTMVVDALYSWHGTDRAFSHTVTVEPHSDGSFRYVANTVTEVKDSIFPKQELCFRRAAMIDRVSP